MDSPGIPDPFASIDEPRTFIKPRPGARLGGLRHTEPAAAPPADLDARVAGLNPLVTLANRLLLAGPQLRATRHVEDPVALRNLLAQDVREFAARAAAAGIAAERVMAARYVLCTMLDEAASETPWGGSGAWAQHSLLTMLHNESWGGEKVFQLMARLAEKPADNRDLLELIYAALVLGFEGRYRVIDNGSAQLEAVRDRLAQIVRQQRGDHAPALAQHWQGQPLRRRAATSWLPLAACAAVAALVLGVLHLSLSLSLSDQSDPVFAQIQSLRLAPPMVTVAQAAPRPRLAQFLQADIKAGLVTVRDEVDRSVVTLRGDGLFEAASAALIPEREALLIRIAEALVLAGGQVLVTGHTDSAPMRSARFPSNWHLSEERARNVQRLLVEHKVPVERVLAEGRADREPVVSNDSAVNRAMNRRVEVTLMAVRSPIGAGGARGTGGTGGTGSANPAAGRS